MTDQPIPFAESPDFVIEARNAAIDFTLDLFQEESDAAAALLPNGEAHLIYRLFGLYPLMVLVYANFDLSFFATMRVVWEQDDPKTVEVEIGWMPPGARPDAGLEQIAVISTLHLRHYRRKWRVESIAPGPFDKPLSVDEAHRLALELEEGHPQYYVCGLLSGALQPHLIGTEPLDEVEALFIPRMQGMAFGLGEIVRGLRLWRDFKHKTHPTYRKPGVYAAAVEYTMTLFGFYEGSQAEVGERYGVAANTVGAKFQEIERVLDLHQYDERYSVHPRPGAEYLALMRQLGTRIPKLRLGGGRRGRGYVVEW